AADMQTTEIQPQIVGVEADVLDGDRAMDSGRDAADHEVLRGYGHADEADETEDDQNNQDGRAAAPKPPCAAEGEPAQRPCPGPPRAGSDFLDHGFGTIRRSLLFRASNRLRRRTLRRVKFYGNCVISPQSSPTEKHLS